MRGLTRKSQEMHDTHEIDLRSLPVTHEDRRYRKTGIFLALFALFWGGIPTVSLVMALFSGEFEPGLLIALIFTIVGAVLFIVGLKLATTHRVIEFTERKVRYNQRSIFGQVFWEEPWSSFTGVRSYSQHHSGGKNSPSYTLYILELFHKDSKKRVRLYESRSMEGIRQRLENYCRQLQMPALEGDQEDSLTVREVEDLGKSVKELAREGRMTVSFDPSQPPPRGVQLSPDEDSLRITLPRGRVLSGGAIVGCLVAGVFTFVGFYVDDVPLLFGMIGPVVLVGIVLRALWIVVTRQILTVQPDQLHIARLTPWGETAGKRIDASHVQDIRVGRVMQNQGAIALLIFKDGDDTPTAVGGGLPKDTLAWICNCVLAVITRGT